MTRFRRMFKQSRGRAVAALAVLALAVAIAVGTGANLTDGSASPGNFVTAGALSMTNDSAGLAKFQLSNVQPDFDIQTGKIVFRNTGTVAGNFFVDPAESLTDQLAVSRLDNNGSPIGAGTLIDAGFEGNSNYSNVRRLSKGLHWKVAKLELCTTSSCSTSSCPTVASSPDPNTPGCWTTGASPQILSDSKLYDGSGPKSIGTLQPATAGNPSYAALMFFLDWPSSSDPSSADRAGVRADWAIHITAAAA